MTDSGYILVDIASVNSYTNRSLVIAFLKNIILKFIKLAIFIVVTIWLLFQLFWFVQHYLHDTEVKPELHNIKQLEKRPWAESLQNGYYKPKNVSYRFALIIPFRDRMPHLRKFLEKMHPYFQSQNAEYQVFVVEQAGSNLFNKASLMNTGYILSKRYGKVPFNCFIFHDVDTFPVYDNVIYKCADRPYHLGARIREFHYRLTYKIVGAVFAVTSQQFQRLNGFSNMYEGWGGEDTDMYIRTLIEYKNVARPPFRQQFYLLKHNRDRTNPENEIRFWQLGQVKNYYKYDGLNNLHFKVREWKSYSNLFTWVKVVIPRPDYSLYKFKPKSIINKKKWRRKNLNALRRKIKD